MVDLLRNSHLRTANRRQMLQSKGCFELDPQFLVSEPRKLKPMMTVVGISAPLQDGEIITSILEKSTNIKQYLNKGLTLGLCFTKTKGDYKHAVIKMSPEICSLILKRNGQIYVELNNCETCDRFWVTQCYLRQGFGHMSSKFQKGRTTNLFILFWLP